MIDKIYRIIKDRPVRPIGLKREYAVLIPLIKIDGSLHILYELRAKDMDAQPGEISFPGGGVEEGETYKEAAIRETIEELGITRDKINILSEIDYLVNSNTMIRCFVGEIKDIGIEDMMVNRAEVDHVFTVPLEFFLINEPDIYTIDFERNMSQEFPYNLIPNGKDYNWRTMKDRVYFYRYNDYVIWGFTARMTNNFINIIKKS